MQQNRELYRSTHSSGGSEFDEEASELEDDPQELESQEVIQGSAAMYEREQRRAKEEQIGGEHTAWHRLNPPALCSVVPWGTPGANDPAAAAGALGLGFPPTASSLRQRQERLEREGRQEREESREERRAERRDEHDEKEEKGERRERRRSSERDRMRSFRHERRKRHRK